MVMAAGIPLVPTHPADPYAGIAQSMRRDYPLIANIPFTVSRGQGPYESEVYQPWDKENPTPNQFHIELRHYLDQPRSQDDIRRLLTGEMFHHLGHLKPDGTPVNPQWYGLKQEVINTLSPGDFANAQRNWQQASQNEGEKRSFADWMQQSNIDQFIGGTMFPLSNEQEWLQRARDLPRYNPQQAKVIERMRQLLTTGR
jgi:hypothetical protein